MWREQARQTLPFIVLEADKVYRLADLARGYLTIDAEHAFDVMSAAITTANRSFDNDGKSVKVSASDESRSITLPSFDVKVTALVNLDYVLEELAKRDFVRTNAIVRTLARPELWLNAQLVACQSILRSEKKQAEARPKTESKDSSKL